MGRQLARFMVIDFWLLLIGSTPVWAQDSIILGRLPNGDVVRTVQNGDKSYGLQIGAAIEANFPIQFIVSGETIDSIRIQYFAARLGYQSIRLSNDTLIGIADYRHLLLARKSANALLARVTDRWLLQNNELRLWRKVTVLANDPHGFATAAYLIQRIGKAEGSQYNKLFVRSQYEQFIPGITYGTIDNLPTKAIGSEPYRQTWIREDRLPIPMVAVRRQDGLSVVVLNLAPIGETTLADSQNFVKNGPDTSSRQAPIQLINERFQIGSLDVSLEDNDLNYTGDTLENRLHTGYVYPALEGPVTYRGNTYPDVGEKAFRFNFHPFKQGFTQQYSLIFRFTQTPDFPTLMRESWRWAWAKLNPQVNRHDIGVARQSLILQLSSQVETHRQLAGITNWRPAVPADPGRPEQTKDPKTIMGFTGKALETAEMLLWASDYLKTDPNRTLYRKQGEALLASFIRTVKLDPPNGEGFIMQTGEPALAIPKDKQVYLRSFTDDLKATLRAYRREKSVGHNHPDWLAWAKSFGDWLLTQQRPDGGLPRSWKPGTGAVTDVSATSSYNAVPMWLLLSEVTTDPVYQQAAIRAGDYAWNQSGQRYGRFTGGTIDNPDVLDKEAGTLSLEAYLALFEKTSDKKWLDRARAAADFAETWIYAWNVPMPADADDNKLHWKKGVPTAGLQLISTGHSLVDAYMAFDVDEYAKLAKFTGDDHYLNVAKLLLHNTLGMTALPGRTYDLRGPGWQQEHWSLAPWRGYGFHRGWLPWVSTSHLNGMIGVEKFDPKLYDALVK